MALLTLPQPEQLPHPDKVRPFAARGMFATTDYMARLRLRAQAIADRAYGPRGRTPHGFHDPVGFIESTRRSNALRRVHALLVRRLVDRAIRLGELQLVAVTVDGGTDLVRLPGDPPFGQGRISRPRYCYEAAKLDLGQVGKCGAVIGCCPHTAGGIYDR